MGEGLLEFGWVGGLVAGFGAWSNLLASRPKIKKELYSCQGEACRQDNCQCRYFDLVSVIEPTADVIGQIKDLARHRAFSEFDATQYLPASPRVRRYGRAERHRGADNPRPSKREGGRRHHSARKNYRGDVVRIYIFEIIKP